jgi:hypothetical protein
MGVGFKAVYKRYRRVRVRDRTWAFRFEEPPVSVPFPSICVGCFD